MKYAVLLVAFLGTVLLAEPHSDVDNSNRASVSDDREIRNCLDKIKKSRSEQYSNQGTFALDYLTPGMGGVPGLTQVFVDGPVSRILFEKMRDAGLKVEKNGHSLVVRGKHMVCFARTFPNDPTEYRCMLNPDPREPGGFLSQK
jgi:hypothetical protein